MTKDLPKIDVPYPDLTPEQRIPGKNLFHAPQPALPAADESAISTGSGSAVQASAATTIANMRSRIDALEAALIKLGLLRHP